MRGSVCVLSRERYRDRGGKTPGLIVGDSCAAPVRARGALFARLPITTQGPIPNHLVLNLDLAIDRLRVDRNDGLSNIYASRGRIRRLYMFV